MSHSLLSAVLDAVERSGSRLLYASLEAALVVALVWVLCRLLARHAPSLRCALWWAACLKLLIGLSGFVLVSLPWLPAAAPLHLSVLGTGVSDPSFPSSTATATPFPIPWSVPFIGLWVAGMLAGLFVTARQMSKARTVVRRASPVTDPRTWELFSDLSRQVGLERTPGLRASDDVRVPQVVGFLTPVVILPRAHLEGFSESDLVMSLCHELVHVRRKDLWLGWVPALARRTFFFHPAAVAAEHEYRVAREAACDAEVLRLLHGSAPGYGRLLLKMSALPSAGLTPSAAVASPFLDLRRRLRMLEHSQDSRRIGRLRWTVVAVLALVLLAPVRVVARTSLSTHDARTGEEHTNIRRPSENAYVFFIDDDTTSMNGSLDEDLPRAIAARGREKGAFLWFRLGDQAYLFRDAKVLDLVRSLGDEHSKLDSGQDAVNRKQDAMGAKMEKLSHDEEKLSLEIDRLSEERDELRDGRDREDEEERDAGDAADLEKLTLRIQQLERRRTEIQEAIDGLSKDMEALGAEQERLGSENERNSELIDQKIYRLLQESVDAGLAEPVEH